MKEGVTKEQLIKSLEATLKLTRNDVEKLSLQEKHTVTIHYIGGGTRVVNIEADSGIAIISDVVKRV